MALMSSARSAGRQQKARLREYFAGQDHLLGIAAGKFARQSGNRRGAHIKTVRPGGEPRP